MYNIFQTYDWQLSHFALSVIAGWVIGLTLLLV